MKEVLTKLDEIHKAAVTHEEKDEARHQEVCKRLKDLEGLKSKAFITGAGIAAGAYAVLQYLN